MKHKIVERLRRLEPVAGCDFIGEPGGCHTVSLVNPDGPEAAKVIETLTEALEGLVSAVEMDSRKENSISGFTAARLHDARDALTLTRDGTGE